MVLIVILPALTLAQSWSDPVLVDSINGIILDFNPSLSADGQTMYFATGNRIMVSHRTGDTWGAPTMLGQNINSGQRQVKATITPDNQTLYFTSWRAGGYGTYDIWKSNWDDSCDCWGVPEVLPPPINTPYMEWDVQLSLDGMYMYFTSNRSFGWGYNDIWCSKWDTTTEAWGNPYNLGNVVNSSSIDECPYPSPDPDVLYFSSLHSHGFEEWQGGTDIFIAYKRDGVWDSLSILPNPINTLHNEGSSAISPDGTELYFSSSRIGGMGFDDIFISRLITDIDNYNENPVIREFDFCLYPNPFNSQTIISYQNLAGSDIEIYDICGRLVKTLHTDNSLKGSIIWNATDELGNGISSGIYFARAKTDDGIVTARMIYLK